MKIDERIDNILADGRSGIWTSMEGGSLRLKEDVLRSCLEMEMGAVRTDALNEAAALLEARAKAFGDDGKAELEAQALNIRALNRS